MSQVLWISLLTLTKICHFAYFLVISGGCLPLTVFPRDHDEGLQFFSFFFKYQNCILITFSFAGNMKPQLKPRTDPDIRPSRAPNTPTSRHGSISCQTTWDISSPYVITITLVSNTNIEEGTKVWMAFESLNCNSSSQNIK